MGKKVILVVEKPTELDNIHRVSERVKIKPSLGMRARLSSRGAGRWEQSGGDFSKFGLTAAEMVDAVGKLKEWGDVDVLKLIHFHLGSQISAIKSIKNALREAGRLFVEMYKMGAKSLSYMDVGGGLGVDYDGSQTNFASSMNYTVQEYANDVVFSIKEAMYKLWSPLMSCWLDFHDAQVRLDPDARRFEVSVIGQPAPSVPPALRRIEGRFDIVGLHVLSAVALPRHQP